MPGQQAPIVFFSMATAKREDVPRNLAFLLSHNRLNGAISRAQCLAYLVARHALSKARCNSYSPVERRKSRRLGKIAWSDPTPATIPTLRSSNSISASSTSHQIQFSTRNPRTRLNSLSLFVASRASRLSACAAISKSMAPIGRPDFSRATLISP